MNLQRLVRLVAGLALALTCACQTTFLANHAVVIYDRGRIADAEQVRNLLIGEGVIVEMQVRGPVPRKQSSIAVYNVSNHPSRPDDVAALLGTVGTFDVLRFPGPNGPTDIVVWLEDDEPAVTEPESE